MSVRKPFLYILFILTISLFMIQSTGLAWAASPVQEETPAPVVEPAVVEEPAVVVEEPAIVVEESAAVVEEQPAVVEEQPASVEEEASVQEVTEEAATADQSTEDTATTEEAPAVETAAEPTAIPQESALQPTTEPQTLSEVQPTPQATAVEVAAVSDTAPAAVSSVATESEESSSTTTTTTEQAASTESSSADVEATSSGVLALGDAGALIDQAADAGVDLLVVDTSGQALPMASQQSADALSAGDPYFTVGGVTYGYSATATCAAGVTVCNGNLSNPIQSAIDGLKAMGGTPVGNTIYVEAGTYNGNVVIDGTGWTGAIPTTLILQGSSLTDTIINGSVNVINMLNFTLQNFTLTSGNTFLAGQSSATSAAGQNTGTLILNNVALSNSAGTGVTVVNQVGDVQLSNVSVTNATGNGISVSNQGTITATSLNVSGNGLTGALLNNSGGAVANVTINGTNTFSNNLLNGLEVHTKGTINANAGSITASGNHGVGVILDNCVLSGGVCTGSVFSDVNLANAAISGNSNMGLKIDTMHGASLTNVDVKNNYNTGIYLNAHLDSAVVTFNNVVSAYNNGAGLDYIHTGNRNITFVNSAFHNNCRAGIADNGSDMSFAGATSKNNWDQAYCLEKTEGYEPENDPFVETDNSLVYRNGDDSLTFRQLKSGIAYIRVAFESWYYSEPGQILITMDDEDSRDGAGYRLLVWRMSVGEMKALDLNPNLIWIAAKWYTPRGVLFDYIYFALD